MQEKEYYSVEEIAQKLGVSVEAVRGWIRSLQLPAYRVGKEYRIKVEDYEEFLKHRRTISDNH
jgi:excisionase family DNA binding protein